MKKIVLFLVAMMCLSSVWAGGKGKVSEISVVKQGGANLGIMLGVPPIHYYENGHHVDPTIPTFSFDANWGVASGFIKTKTFGNNGGVDLGGYYAINHYKGYGHGDGYHYDYYYDYHDYDDFYNHHKTDGMIQHSILFRAAFHWEFVKNLDVFLGIANGVNIYSATREHHGWDFTDCKYAGGFYGGVKYYFTKCFGVKMEFGSDWNDGNICNFAGGVTFKF